MKLASSLKWGSITGGILVFFLSKGASHNDPAWNEASLIGMKGLVIALTFVAGFVPGAIIGLFVKGKNR